MEKKVTLTVHDRISRSAIMIDEQNLNVFISKYTRDIKKQTNFLGYAIACISVILALATCNFHDFLTIKASVWEAFFLLCACILVVVTLTTAVNAWRISKVTPESLIE